MPKVSVIVPVYNVERFLPDCIESLLSQTLEEIELIFVNDASPDGSLQILQEYARRYPEKIVVIDNQVNKRQGGARNDGIRRARGEYIGFVDSDDLVAPDMFAALYEKIRAQQADAAFIAHARISEAATLREVSADRERGLYTASLPETMKKIADHPLTPQEKESFMVLKEGASVWSGLYKKSLLLEHQLFFPEHLAYEDNYWVSLLRCYLSKIACVDQVGYYYRLNLGSTSKAKNSPQYDDRLVIETRLLEEVKARGLFEEYYSVWEFLFAERFCINTCLSYITRFDEIPLDKISVVQQMLQREFPHWEQNKFLENSAKEKLRRLLAKYPPHSLRARLLYSLIRFNYEHRVLKNA